MTGEGVSERVELNGDTMESKKSSKLRQTIPQIYAASAENFVLLAYGSFIGFITIVVSELEKNQMNIPDHKTAISWISSLFTIFAPIGCLISCPLSIFLGRKTIMQLSMIPYSLIWLIFYYSTTPKGLYLAFSLAGLISGVFVSSTTSYIAEITQPHLRGILLSFSSTSVLIGIFVQFFTGLFTDWRTASLISLIYPVLGFLFFSFVPESPYWLAEKRRIEDAKKSLCWLRGWVSPAQVQEELNMIRETTKNSADDEDNKAIKTTFWIEFRKRQCIRPFILTTLCFLIGTFGGSTAVQFHCALLFKKIESPIDVNVATMLLGLAELVGTVVSLVVIYFTGKRIINFASIGGNGLCYLGIYVYIYITTKSEMIDGNSLSWIPTTFLIGSGFFSHLGIKCLPWILLGEIFPSEVKSIATGILVALSYFFDAAAGGTFLNIYDITGLSGTFLLFAGINFVGCAAIYIWLPETEGRSLYDIKLHFSGIQNLKDKPHKRESKMFF